MSEKPNEPRSSMAQQAGMALMIPSLLVSGPFVGYGLAWVIRKWIGGGNWVTITLVLLGLAAGIRESILIIRRLSK